MRATLISMLAVAALSAGICICSVTVIGAATEELDAMRIEVLRLIEQGDAAAARERLGQMEEEWSQREERLAALAPHESLHGIKQLLIEGIANLEAGDADDFNRSMALLGEFIRHLHEEERLSLANIM